MSDERKRLFGVFGSLAINFLAIMIWVWLVSLAMVTLDSVQAPYHFGRLS